MATTTATRTIKAGPRGGRYYINKNGGKTYVDRSTPVDQGSGNFVWGIGFAVVVVLFGFIGNL
jgi:hypothetical protein